MPQFIHADDLKSLIHLDGDQWRLKYETAEVTAPKGDIFHENTIKMNLLFRMIEVLMQDGVQVTL